MVARRTRHRCRRSLKLYITGVVALSAIALVVATLVFPPIPTIAHRRSSRVAELPAPSSKSLLGHRLLDRLDARSRRPCRCSCRAAPSRPSQWRQSSRRCLLGGPAVGGWVAAIGTTEIRELRGRIPWYGSLANHAGVVLPAIVGGSRALEVLPWPIADGPVVEFLARRSSARRLLRPEPRARRRSCLALRTGQPFATSSIGDSREIVCATALALGAARLADGRSSTRSRGGRRCCSRCRCTRRDMASQRFVEMRDMFTQTIGALAEAVDKRDPYTARHSQRVKEIAVDIGRVMRVNDAELEALEWGGLLHDVGKIGVPDDVLLKPDRLTREERMIMNAHPVLGAQIIAPVTKLAPGAADHPPPPRVVQRLGLPGPADRRRDPEARPDPPRRRRLRGDDGRPAVPDDAADHRAGARRAAQVRRHPVRPGRRRCLRPDARTSTASRTRAGPPSPRQIPLIAQAADRMTAAAHRRHRRGAGRTGLTTGTPPALPSTARPDQPRGRTSADRDAPSPARMMPRCTDAVPRARADRRHRARARPRPARRRRLAQPRVDPAARVGRC